MLENLKVVCSDEGNCCWDQCLLVVAALVLMVDVHTVQAHSIVRASHSAAGIHYDGEHTLTHFFDWILMIRNVWFFFFDILTSLGRLMYWWLNLEGRTTFARAHQFPGAATSRLTLPHMLMKAHPLTQIFPQSPSGHLELNRWLLYTSQFCQRGSIGSHFLQPGICWLEGQKPADRD